MLPSLKIGRFFGVELFIHWTFWLLPIWVMVTWSDNGVFPLWMHLLIIGAVFFCIVLHEYGHALMGQHFGIRTRSITLSPLGGMAQMERMPRDPWQEFCIAVAGPLVNVVIAAILGAGLLVFSLLGGDGSESLLFRFIIALTVINVLLVLFNVLPAFPMDGGRMLRAVLAHWLGYLGGTRVAVIVGTVTAIGMGLAGLLLLGNPRLILISLFVIWAGFQELRALEMQERERLAGMEEEAAADMPRSASVTVCMWDAERRRWVRRTYDD